VISRFFTNLPKDIGCLLRELACADFLRQKWKCSELPMLKRDEWLRLARKLDWEYSYVSEKDVFPEEISGRLWLPHS